MIEEIVSDLDVEVVYDPEDGLVGAYPWSPQEGSYRLYTGRDGKIKIDWKDNSNFAEQEETRLRWDKEKERYVNDAFRDAMKGERLHTTGRRPTGPIFIPDDGDVLDAAAKQFPEFSKKQLADELDKIKKKFGL